VTRLAGCFYLFVKIFRQERTARKICFILVPFVGRSGSLKTWRSCYEDQLMASEVSWCDVWIAACASFTFVVVVAAASGKSPHHEKVGKRKQEKKSPWKRRAANGKTQQIVTGSEHNLTCTIDIKPHAHTHTHSTKRALKKKKIDKIINTANRIFFLHWTLRGVCMETQFPFHNGISRIFHPFPHFSVGSSSSLAFAFRSFLSATAECWKIHS